MKKKVKKFGRGGDILTGLGAGLMGYALYKKLKGEDKDEKEPESVGGASRRPKTIEEQIGRKAEPKDEKRREISDYMTNKPKKTEGGETRPGTDTAEPDLEYKGKKAAPAKPAAKPTKVEPAAQPKTSSVGMAGIPISTAGKANADLPSKPYPKGVKGKDTDPYLRPSLGLGLDERQQARRDFLSRRAAEAKEKIDAEEKAKAEKRKGASEVKYDEMGNPMKKGGAVKKYASGGTVKSSASKRADGIAQRGKTRGRIY